MAAFNVELKLIDIPEVREMLSKAVTVIKCQREALEVAQTRLEEDGCDCGADDPPCALCAVQAALELVTDEDPGVATVATDLKDRGTGRTTRQMMEAPQKAVFIWCNSNLAYPRDLAAQQGRGDLEIVAPYWLERRLGSYWLERRLGYMRVLTGIVVDHAAELTTDQQEGLACALTRVR